MFAMKKNVMFIIAVFLAFALLYLLLRRVSRGDMIRNVQGIRWRWSVAAFFLYAFVNFLRGYRFYVLLGKKISLREMFGVAFTHNFLTNLFPFRAGEFSYPYFLRRIGFAQDGEAFASLVASRLFDVFLVAQLILVSFVAVLIPLAVSGNSKALFWIVAALFFLSSFLFIFFMEKLVALVQRLFLAIRFQKFHFFSFVMAKIEEARRVFLFVKTRNGFFFLLFLSLLIWVFNFYVDWMLLLSAGIYLSFWQIVFVFSFPLMLSELSPVQSFANFGVYEWSLAGGLLLLGVSQRTGAIASVLVHAQGFLFALVLGGAGAIMLFVLFPNIQTGG